MRLVGMQACSLDWSAAQPMLQHAVMGVAELRAVGTQACPSGSPPMALASGRLHNLSDQGSLDATMLDAFLPLQVPALCEEFLYSPQIVLPAYGGTIHRQAVQPGLVC